MAFLLSAVCIAVYTILVGAQASVVRAAIMGTLSWIARQIGRLQDGLNTDGEKMWVEVERP